LTAEYSAAEALAESAMAIEKAAALAD